MLTVDTWVIKHSVTKPNIKMKVNMGIGWVFCGHFGTKLTIDTE